MEKLLFQVDTERKLMKSSEKQELHSLSCCKRKAGMEKIILTGKIAGKRTRGRQRIIFLQKISEWSGISGIELIQCTENRNEWHKLVADIIR